MANPGRSGWQQSNLIEVSSSLLPATGAFTTLAVRPWPRTDVIRPLPADRGGRVRSEFRGPARSIFEAERIGQVCKPPKPSDRLDDRSSKAHVFVNV